MDLTAKFNLLDEPWLEVETLQGSTERVGIIELFERAADLRGLAQASSTERFALLRVLLAFLHRATRPTSDDWSEMWHAGIPPEAVRAYADSVHERFWLRHSEYPFFQTPTLTAPKGPESGLRALVADLPNGNIMFTNRSVEDVTSLSWEEAAVWLIHAQAYDTAGIKTGAIGDPLVISGKGYGYGLPAWCGQIGGLSARGGTLHETLLLNLNARRFSEADLPAWERDVPTAWRGDDKEFEAQVTGPVHLMTWQARRVLLEWDENHAVGVTLSQGDRITPQLSSPHQFEGMTAWRYSEPQSKKFGRPIFMPLQHDPSRQAWRGITRLLGLPEPPRPQKTKSSVTVVPPETGLVEWVSEVGDEINLSHVEFELAGYQYGPQNATFEEIIDDSMGVPALILTDDSRGAQWRVAVSNAVAQADATAWLIRRFADNLGRASGQDRPEMEEWRERCFASLDHPFRAWIAGIATDVDVTAVQENWQRICRGSALQLADELMSGLGLHAHAGHGSGASSEPMTPGRAYAQLLSGLSRELPLTAKNPHSEGHQG